jgi:SHS2 domain-containing protein
LKGEGLVTFRELEHTADVRIRIEAPTLATLFEEAGAALFSVMYGACQPRPPVNAPEANACAPEANERHISIESADLESLLADYLSELLYLSEVEGIVFCSFGVAISGTILDATVLGEPLDPSIHAGREVKGISYSGLAIQETADGYAAEIIFDI